MLLGIISVLKYFRTNAEEVAMGQTLFKGLLSLLAGLFIRVVCYHFPRTDNFVWYCNYDCRLGKDTNGDGYAALEKDQMAFCFDKRFTFSYYCHCYFEKSVFYNGGSLDIYRHIFDC